MKKCFFPKILKVAFSNFGASTKFRLIYILADENKTFHNALFCVWSLSPWLSHTQDLKINPKF
jgi:hypothetical protein